jgi:hypothetical protein
MGFGWYSAAFHYDLKRLPLFADETKKNVGWHFGGGDLNSNFTPSLSVSC